MILSTSKILNAGFVALSFLLTACGGGGGTPTTTTGATTASPPTTNLKIPTLGLFTIAPKALTDATFTLTAPTSDSPGTFSFQSQNLSVATISGSTVTIIGVGTALIVATQDAAGGYMGGTRTYLLSVTQRHDGFLDFGGLAWMPNTGAFRTWADANAYCTSTTIDGKTGWRLPTQAELQALITSHAAAGNNWLSAPTWTSTVAGVDSYYAIHIYEYRLSLVQELNPLAVTCVR